MTLYTIGNNMEEQSLLLRENLLNLRRVLIQTEETTKLDIEEHLNKKR